MSNLVIVESVAKSKTIKKFLGPKFEVMASVGHIRDLPKSKLGIDVDNNFKPQYVNMTDKKEVIKGLKSAASDSDTIYLATDPDREGEAIAWHLSKVLNLDEKDIHRVKFNEITKNGIMTGMSSPEKIDMDLVDAQQARRVLDRLVGYKISPFLWKKVKRGLSAGRVQSVALKLVVDRENEIRAFKPTEYWKIVGDFKHGNSKFSASLFAKENEKIETIADETSANKILKDLENADYSVKSIKKGTRNRQPAPPFITSTLQQEAARKLGFTGERTMRIAQALYEGVNIAELGVTGLITYMRTDSVRISDEARSAANEVITSKFGENYIPSKPRVFKAKKGAQDAHEAIRPAVVTLEPDSIKDSLTPEQYKLYKLIWSRFIASLMSNCIQNTIQVDVEGNGYIFRANGYSVKFDGFTALYTESKDEEEEENSKLPAMEQGDALKLSALSPSQHFTQPPARYTEPTLVKALEENGVGRPATYVPIITNILKKEYIVRDKKALKPTDLGEIVTDIMAKHFTKIVNVKFTAEMEGDLDKVEAGNKDWTEPVKEFYDEFKTILEKAEKDMDGVKVKLPEEVTDVICDKCGRNMVIKSGRFGKFLACPGYPDCKNTKPIVVETVGDCPLCGSKIIEKKTKKNKKFFGCSSWPKCNFMTWDEPTNEKCPNCGKTLFKKRGGVYYCFDENCGFEKVVKKGTKKDAE